MINKIQSRTELKEYALRQLGYPVIRINIDSDQIEDCINNAISKFVEEHMEGYQFDIEIVPLIANEDSYELNDNIYNVIDIISYGSGSSYEGILINPWDFFHARGYSSYMDLTGFRLLQERLKLIEKCFRRKYLFTFQKGTHILKVFPTPTEDQDLGIIVHRINDPYDYNDLYDTLWLKNYTVALLGVQWGRNITKFGSVPLPGGSILNGESILQNYTQMQKDLEVELKEKYSEPPEPQIG